MVLRKHEAPHMAYHKFIPQPQRFPQCFPFLLMKGVFGKVYRIIDDRDLSTVSQVFPIHPNSGQLAAGEVAIGKKSGKGAQNVFHDIPLRLTWGRGAVIVQDTHGYSRKPGRKKRKGRECIHIRMDDPVMILSDHLIDFSGKSEGIFIVWCYFVHMPPNASTRAVISTLLSL